jgi:hypothetical protein
LLWLVAGLIAAPMLLAVVGSAYVFFINETHDLSLNLERQEMEPGRYAVSDCLHSVTQAARLHSLFP